MHSVKDLQKMAEDSAEAKRAELARSRPEDVKKFLNTLDTRIVSAAQKNQKYISVDVGTPDFMTFHQFGQQDRSTIEDKLEELGYKVSFFRSSFTISW
jgi:hypothetical protein